MYLWLLDFATGDTFLLKLDVTIANDGSPETEEKIFEIIEGILFLDFNNCSWALSDVCPSNHTGGLKYYRELKEQAFNTNN